MKGVIMNAGEGKRLYPITKCISKGLVPVYDKPALMYQISFFADMGITEAAVVISAEQEKSYRDFLGRIDTQGVSIRLYVQKAGVGFLAAYASCLDFMRGNDILMVMGDCLFFISDVQSLKMQAQRCFDQDKVGIVQGPAKAGENVAIFQREADCETPVYRYRAAKRGELCPVGMHFVPKSLTYSVEAFIEPTNTELDAAAVSTLLIERRKLILPSLSPDDRWFDIGTAEQLFQASSYVRSLVI